MSAQIITALRKRAEALEARGEQIQPPGADTRHLLLTLAREFRALADTAEAR